MNNYKDYNTFCYGPDYTDEITGTKYRVVDAANAKSPIRQGDIVTLIHHERYTTSALFQLRCGRAYYMCWRRLERIEGPR